MNKEITVTKYIGKSKKTGNEFRAVQLRIGDWSTLVFPRSNFESEYIFKILDEFNRGK